MFTSSNYNEININVILNEKSRCSFFEEIFNWAKTYININVSFIELNSTNDKNILNNIKTEDFDFYFVDYMKKYSDFFSWDFYSSLHNKNKRFTLVMFLEEYRSDDFQIFKNGADDIIYNNYNFDDIKWKVFSLLRRHWSFIKKDKILIRNGVVIDLYKEKVITNNKEIHLTKKEMELLSILVDEFNKNHENFITKRECYKKIYNMKNHDNSRLIDQLIFRIKKKLGKNFFEINKKGIRIL